MNKAPIELDRITDPRIRAQVRTVLHDKTELPGVKLLRASNGWAHQPHKGQRDGFDRFLFQLRYTQDCPHWIQLLVLVNEEEVDIIVHGHSADFSGKDAKPTLKDIKSIEEWDKEDPEALLNLLKECRLFFKQKQAALIKDVGNRVAFEFETSLKDQVCEFYVCTTKSEVYFWLPITIDHDVLALLNDLGGSEEKYTEITCTLRLVYSVSKVNRKKPGPQVSVIIPPQFKKYVLNDFSPPGWSRDTALMDYTPFFRQKLNKVFKNCVDNVRARQVLLNRVVEESLPDHHVIGTEKLRCYALCLLHHGKRKEPLYLSVEVPAGFPSAPPIVTLHWFDQPSYGFNQKLNFAYDCLQEPRVMLRNVQRELSWQIPDFLQQRADGCKFKRFKASKFDDSNKQKSRLLS